MKKYLDTSLSAQERAFTAVDANGEIKIFGKHFTLYAGTSQPDAVSRALGFECVSKDTEL